jgi:protein TonB
MAGLSFGQADTITPPLPPSVIFDDVDETMALFPGCEEIEDYVDKKPCTDQKMMDFIYSELVYPAEALEIKLEGIVVISFEVDEAGNLSDITVRRKIGSGCDEEALRVVQKMAELPKKWTAATFQGKIVKMRFNLPIRFRLAK